MPVLDWQLRFSRNFTSSRDLDMRRWRQYPRRNRSPPFLEDRDSSVVKRRTNPGFFGLRDSLHASRATYLLDAHHTVQIKGMPGENSYVKTPRPGNLRNRRERPGPSLILLFQDLAFLQLAREELGGGQDNTGLAAILSRPIGVGCCEA